MAYEMFDELSTMSLDEICEEDLEKIKDDIETELRRRNRVKRAEAIAKFKEAFEELQEANVYLTVPIHCDECSCYCSGVPITMASDFRFED